MRKEITNNPKPITLIVTKLEIESLLNYIVEITKIKEEFKFYFGESTRFFIIYHMEEIRSRLIQRILIHKEQNEDKKINFSFNYAEIKAFDFLFKKEPPQNAYVLVMQNKIINGIINNF